MHTYIKTRQHTRSHCYLIGSSDDKTFHLVQKRNQSISRDLAYIPLHLLDANPDNPRTLGFHNLVTSHTSPTLFRSLLTLIRSLLTLIRSHCYLTGSSDDKT